MTQNDLKLQESGIKQLVAALKIEVSALKAELKKVQRQNAKYRAENLSLKSKISTSEKEFAKQIRRKQVTVVVARDGVPLKT